MIVVVGRPGLDGVGQLTRPAARIALAAAEAGSTVELVGAVGDDADGEAAVLELGRNGIGHAALLRDPGGATPREPGSSPLPRLDAADVALGLSYLAECQVLVVAEPVAEAALNAALDAAAYHRAALVVLTDGQRRAAALPADATVLDLPDEDSGAFALLVGIYAARLDAGDGPASAWQNALAGSGWERAAT